MDTALWVVVAAALFTTIMTGFRELPFPFVKKVGNRAMGWSNAAAASLVLAASHKQPRRTDNTLVKALARAIGWKRILESGEFATIAELAEHEGIVPSYMIADPFGSTANSSDART